MTRQFTNILIANRGEIACRLIRACHDLGIEATAVFSDADENALHVSLADHAIHIGASEARASYLDSQKIIDAAKSVGAEAIHPGYGFLAENADFAQSCADAGLVFIGPSPKVIASMGAKIEAKRIAESANVTCVPGYHGDDQSDEILAAEAERIGTPLLIKASAGGGGRGMRRIDDLSDVTAQLALARQEAQAAFGDPKVLLERYVTAPRHVEVQILGDSHGNVRHLFERDCSVQRNYQKIIEEAPAPNLTPTLREQMLNEAVALAESIGYDSAGTVEFVVDAERQEAYFLEMNTRLQVEHPVTELVTGIDLAQWQIHIAAGEAIDFEQASVQCQGWAIEARVAAEDPANNYAPETGEIVLYREPNGPGLRTDSGIRTGSNISPYYDSMLAKLIAYGDDRNQAITRLRKALGEFVIGGVGVNNAFLGDVLELEAFTEGNQLTSLLGETYPGGWTAPALSDTDIAHAVLIHHIAAENQASSGNAWAALGAWRLGEPHGRIACSCWHVDAGNRWQQVVVSGRLGNYQVSIGEHSILETQQASWADGKLRYRAANQIIQVAAQRTNNELRLHSQPNQAIQIQTADQALLGDTDDTVASGNAVLAPTPGLIAQVLVKEGDDVEAGQPVIVLEAMKLFQELKALEGGTVDRVGCAVGDSVNSGDILLTVET